MAIRASGHSITGHISLSHISHAARWYNRPYRISSQHGHAMCIRRAGGRAKYSTHAQCSLGVTAVNVQHWTALMLISVTGHALERQPWIGRVASAPILVMLVAALASAAQAIPQTCVAYDLVWSALMPFGAALCLLEVDLTDLARLWKDVRPTTVAFVIGAGGIVVGTFLAWLLVGNRLGSEGAKIAAALAASYIGGSINFAATSAALGLTPKLLAGAMAADNIAMALYLAVISAWPVPAEQKSSIADAAYSTNSASADSTLGRGSPAKPSEQSQRHGGQDSVLARAAVASVAAAAACWAGDALARVVGFQSGGLAFTTLAAAVIAAAASTATSRRQDMDRLFAGSSRIGSALLLPFFATIGAAAGGLDALSDVGWLFCLIAIQLVTHVIVIISGGRLLKLPMDAILTASNANVGGPATAAATAAVRNWPHLVQPAVLTGTLGYAVGTAIGCAIGWALGA